mmetsp:Transcript_18172/g.30372  ORF Transcript_18172/g.30372 Transcript_18172/m.30372 type:complete len:471 (+) Transcript_18172:21-1433(+)|eukprot:CAMPEP_0119321882 /NCGR_PEP_ID=MMETSP1333-20130426/56693_1 /TAXON_ID=418940 /ORGANISM="Scyphosphaera apsteinii, Strain RCC1455" /LENGTH=470 /DNA_ID=CAMNT_0007328965 /DNA_START=17 /DNA_END=1429 /DNA_ORIENTATION=-
MTKGAWAVLATCLHAHLQGVHADGYNTAMPETKVIVLDKSNFDQLVSNDPQTLWLIKFYAPWCGHCKRMAPVLEEVAMGIQDRSIKIGKVDCTVEKALKDRWQVNGYPTVYLVKGSTTWEYSGPRTKAGLEDVIKRVSQPAVAEVRSQRELDSLVLPAGKVVFVFAHDSGYQESHLNAKFAEVAEAIKHMESFASVRHTELQPFFSKLSAQMPKLPFIAKIEANEAPQILPGDKLAKMSVAAVKDWVQARSFPLVTVINSANFASLLRNKAALPVAILAFDRTALCAGKSDEDACMERELGEETLVEGPGAIFRQIARESTFASTDNQLSGENQSHFVYGILDAQPFGSYLEEALFTTTQQLPRLLLVRGASSSTRSFALGEANSVTDESMRAFLTAASRGRIHFEYMGIWGVPDRWWRIVTRYVPLLKALNFMPHYSFAAIVILLVCYFIYKITVGQSAYPDDDDRKRE